MNRESTMAKPSIAEAPKEAMREAVTSPWVRWAIRLGYIAKAVLYLVIGWLAMLVAFDQGGTTTDRTGALKTLAFQPYGQWVLTIIAVGLTIYTAWYFLRALLDLDREGDEPKGLLSRAVMLGVGLYYLTLAWAATQLAFNLGEGGSGDDSMTQEWTAQLLQMPAGPLLVIVFGLLMLGTAVVQLYIAISGKYQVHLDLAKMRAEGREWLVQLGRVGIIARAAIYALIGLFLFVAANQHNAAEAKGFAGVLSNLGSQPFGPFLLGAVAAGLFAFGLYALVQARYFKV